MTLEEAVLAVLDALEASAIPYVVVGSLSSNLYGIPRSTQDADFVVHVERDQLRDVRTRLKPPLRWDPQIRFETVIATPMQVIHVGNTGFRIELFLLTDDGHAQSRFARRVPVEVFGRRTWAPTPEDVVVTKLRWAKLAKRTKDVDDVKSVLTVQGTTLDWDYTHHWCDQHGTRELLDELRRSIPEI